MPSIMMSICWLWKYLMTITLMVMTLTAWRVSSAYSLMTMLANADNEGGSRRESKQLPRWCLEGEWSCSKWGPLDPFLTLWTFFSRPLLRSSTFFTWKTKLKLMLFKLVQTNVPLFRPRRLKQFEKSNSKEGMQKFRIAWEGGGLQCAGPTISHQLPGRGPDVDHHQHLKRLTWIHGKLLEPKRPTLIWTIINISSSLANHMTGTPTHRIKLFF